MYDVHYLVYPFNRVTQYLPLLRPFFGLFPGVMISSYSIAVKYLNKGTVLLITSLYF